MILFIVSWAVCAFLSVGLGLGYFAGRWPELAKEQYRQDLGLWFFLGMMFGPLTLVTIFCLSGFGAYGVRWRRPK